MLRSTWIRATKLGAFALVALTARTALAQAGGVIMRTQAPSDNVQLSAEQLRDAIAVRFPAIASGSAHDNMVTFVLASNGDYVASASSYAEPVAVARVSSGAATGAAGATAATAAGSVAVAGGAMAGAAVPRATAIGRPDDGQPHLINIEGVGDIDASLIKSMSIRTYAAGEVSVNAVRVRLITLRGNSIK